MLGCTKLADLFHASPWILFQEFLYVIESVIIIDMQGFFFKKKSKLFNITVIPNDKFNNLQKAGWISGK